APPMPSEPPLSQLRPSSCSDRNNPAWTPWSDATPRDLLARLLSVIRAHGPAVVFLDVDLRSQTSGNGDAKLLAALEEEPQRFAPVLLPRLLEEQDGRGCDVQERDMEPAPRAFATIADKRKGQGAVFFVHPYVEVDALGYVNGVCSQLDSHAGANS